MNQKLLNYPFWIICSIFCLGVFVSSFSEYILTASTICCLLLISFLTYFYKRNSNTLFLTLASSLFFILGILRYQIANPKYNAKHIINTSKVLTPKKLVISINEVFKESKTSRNYKVQIHNCNNKKIDGYALLSIKKNNEKTNFKLTDTFITYAIIKPLKQTGNPYAFEYTDYLKNKGITHKIWATEQQLFQIKTIAHPLSIFFGNIRHYIEANLKKQALIPEVLQITEALILGNKSSLNQELKTNFANAGVIHILAISGLHIGVIYFILSGLFSLIFPFSKNSIGTTLCIISLLWLFTWFSGSSPSALRATTMFTCFQFSKSILRQQHPINALFLSVFILVTINPNIVFSVGFQLSVTAVCAIIIGVPKLLAFWYPKHWFVNKVWSIICVSLCAQIGIIPLSIYYFHQFSSLFLLANIPIMLIIVFVLSWAILIVLASCFGQIPSVLINLYNNFIQNLISYINWIADFEAFIIKNLYINSITLATTYFVFGVVIYSYKKPRKIIKFSLPVLSLILLVSFWEYKQRSFKNELWILNNYDNTIITELSPNKLDFYSSNKLSVTDSVYLLKPLIGNLHYLKANTYILQNTYDYQDRSVYVVNSKYYPLNIQKDIFILDHSPKINLERLLQIHQPKAVIASAYNYSNLLEKWKATCLTKQVAFYSVSENGALNLTKYLNR